MRLYFKEIKNRLILILLLQISTFSSLYYYKSIILFTVTYPVFKIGSFTVYYFIFTDITEPFTVYIKLIIFINKQLVLMYFLYHFCMFLVPALYKSEIRIMFLFLKIVFLLWQMNAIVTNSFLIPWTWICFLDFYSTSCSDSTYMYFEARLIEYLNFYISFYWVNLLYFQLIGLFFLLLNLPQITLQFIQRYRKFFYICFALLSALICPDACSQLIFASVLLFSYELCFILKVFKT